MISRRKSSRGKEVINNLFFGVRTFMPPAPVNKREEILPPLSEDDKMLSGLCYPLWFLACPYVLLTEKKKELFLYFHALQGLIYGAGTTTFTFFSVLFVYMVFFFRNPKQVVNPDAKFETEMAFSTVSVFILLGIFFLVVLLLLLTLYFGWKASTGKVFRFPVIGGLAYDTMSKARTRLEMEYFNSLEHPPPEVEETFPEYGTAMPPYDLEGQYPPVPMAGSEGPPGSDSVDYQKMRKTVTQIKKFLAPTAGPVDYQKMLRMNPPVEKLKSIFTGPSTEEQEHVQAEQPMNPGRFQQAEPVVEQQSQVRFQAQARQVAPHRPPQAHYEPPPQKRKPRQDDSRHSGSMGDSRERAISAMEKMVKKRHQTPQESVSAMERFVKMKEQTPPSMPSRAGTDDARIQQRMKAAPTPRREQAEPSHHQKAQATSFLSAEAHVELLKRKYEQSQMEFRKARENKSRSKKPTKPSQAIKQGEKKSRRPGFGPEKEKQLLSSQEQLEVLRQRYANIVNKDNEPVNLRRRNEPQQKPTAPLPGSELGEPTRWPGLRKRRPGQGREKPQ